MAVSLSCWFGEYTFKQLVEGFDGRCLAPRSTNKAHQTIRLAKDEEVTAVARFVALLEDGGVEER